MARSIVIAYNSDWTASDVRANETVVVVAQGIADVLVERGFEARIHPVAGPDVCETLIELRQAPPTLVFNLCESLLQDTRHELILPALLDLHAIPYTGSPPLALGFALHKPRAKQILRQSNVPTPAALAIPLGESGVAAAELGFPLIVKPSREDASIGIDGGAVVSDVAALERRVAYIHAHFHQDALVEHYIDGRELYVTVLGNGPSARILPIHEIDFAKMPKDMPRIVTYDGKWSTDHVEYEGTVPMRAELDEPTRVRVERAARGALAAIGVRDYGRVDIRLAADGTPYVIDVNPNCDLSKDAGVARAASAGGLSYADLIETICQEALARASREQKAA